MATSLSLDLVELVHELVEVPPPEVLLGHVSQHLQLAVLLLLLLDEVVLPLLGQAPHGHPQQVVVVEPGVEGVFVRVGVIPGIELVLIDLICDHLCYQL